MCVVLVRGSCIFAYSYTSLQILQNIEHKGTEVKLGLLYVKFAGWPSFFPFKKVSLRTRARFILGQQDSENSQWDSWVTGMLGSLVQAQHADRVYSHLPGASTLGPACPQKTLHVPFHLEKFHQDKVREPKSFPPSKRVT